MKVKQEAWDFFLYSYFGIFSSDDENERMFKCAQKAYFDLNRTLKFDDKLKDKDKEKEKRNEAIKAEYTRRVSKYIVNQMIDLKKNTERNLIDVIEDVLKRMKNIQFKHDNCWHNVLKEKDTHFGQAQKWVNMTIKYMWLIGLWNDDMPMDVPVDSYIMEAAAGRKYRNKVLRHEGCGIELPCPDGKKRLWYREDDKMTSSKVWSQWNDKEYIDFQDELRKKRDDKQALLEWENNEWIKIAEKRNKKISFEDMRNVKHDDNVITIE